MQHPPYLPNPAPPPALPDPIVLKKLSGQFAPPVRAGVLDGLATVGGAIGSDTTRAAD